MSHSNIVPDVSLITSWYVPSKEVAARSDALEAIRMPLQEGVRLLDLYFLNHTDIPQYARIIGRQTGEYSEEPHGFVADLTKQELRKIADRLREMLTEYYGGHLVGRRPRFTAIASFFPNISLPEGEEDPQGKSRQQAVAAVQKTLYLARCLGCHCVEIVGGAGVPGPKFRQSPTSPISPADYRERRLDTLARSLCDVYNLDNAGNLLSEFRENPNNLPVVAVELEPGISFLLNDYHQFDRLRQRIVELNLGGWKTALGALKINVDLAHAFLIGYEPQDIEHLMDHVAHMHISDHAGHKDIGGAHAADLAPGLFHYFEDYRDWLKKAIDLKNHGECFSGVIAVEMEACNDLVAVLDAMHITRRWLWELRGDPPGATAGKTPDAPADRAQGAVSGALLVVDIGNSTQCFLGGVSALAGAKNLEREVAKLCGTVNGKGGAVLSYTGDGFVAFFDESEFASSQETAERALRTAKDVCVQLTPESGEPLTARAALHWGIAYLPSSGQLADQIIGREVVCATRVCDWLGKVIEPAVPPTKRHHLIAATRAFCGELPKDVLESEGFDLWGEQELKGLGKIEVLLRSVSGP